MDKIKKYFEIITILLLVFIFINECISKSKINKIEKRVENIEKTSIPKDEIIKELKINGLESEKRMIQATDRKLLDVQRQSEIEKEINALRNGEVDKK